MKGYRHLTLHDRFRIEKMLCNQCSKTEIANALHVNVSTISREVKRGSCTYTNNDGTEVHKYIPEWSHARYRQHLEAKGRRLKIYYMTQVSTNPPSFVFFVNRAELFHFSYQRYIENQIRETFSLDGTPIVFKIRERDRDDVK